MEDLWSDHSLVTHQIPSSSLRNPIFLRVQLMRSKAIPFGLKWYNMTETKSFSHLSWNWKVRGKVRVCSFTTLYSCKISIERCLNLISKIIHLYLNSLTEFIWQSKPKFYLYFPAYISESLSLFISLSKDTQSTSLSYYLQIPLVYIANKRYSTIHP